jgi:hypothetical protein
VIEQGYFAIPTPDLYRVRWTMILTSRTLVLVLCATLWLTSVRSWAQGPDLVNGLGHLQEQVDGSLELLRPLLEGQSLASWNGLTTIPPSQVEAIMAEVGARLEAMRAPLNEFAEGVALQLETHVSAPVLDDIGIAGRDIDRALLQLPIAAQAHQAHSQHAGGCRHDNVPMLTAVELIRDISATLATIDGTFQLFGISETQ